MNDELKQIEVTHPSIFGDESEAIDFLTIKKYPEQVFYISEKLIQKHTIDKQVLRETFRKIHDLYNEFSKLIDKDLKKVNKSCGSKFHARLWAIENELRLEEK